MSERHHFVIVRTRLGALHAEQLDVEACGSRPISEDLVAVLPISEFERQASKLCEDVVAVQGGERVQYGIVRAASIDDARAASSHIAWLGSIYFNDRRDSSNS